MAADAGSSQAHPLEVLTGALVGFGAWPASQQLDPGLPIGYWL